MCSCGRAATKRVIWPGGPGQWKTGMVYCEECIKQVEGALSQPGEDLVEHQASGAAYMETA